MNKIASIWKSLGPIGQTFLVLTILYFIGSSAKR